MKIILFFGVIIVLPFKEISLRPKLSSPPLFRTQEGSPERDKAVGAAEGAAVVAGRYFPFLIEDYQTRFKLGCSANMLLISKLAKKVCDIIFKCPSNTPMYPPLKLGS